MRPKHEPRQQNKTEAEYDAYLADQKALGEILDYCFEPFKLRLGESWKTTYKPDFLVLRADGTLEMVDVKGGGGCEEDARVKIKVAKRLYPIFHWVGATLTKTGWQARFFKSETLRHA